LDLMVVHTKPLVMSGTLDEVEKLIYVQLPVYKPVSFVLLLSSLLQYHLFLLVQLLRDREDLRINHIVLHINLVDLQLLLHLALDLHHIRVHLSNEFFLYKSQNKLLASLTPHVDNKKYTSQLYLFSSQNILFYMDILSCNNANHGMLPGQLIQCHPHPVYKSHRMDKKQHNRSEEHTSELQSRFDLVCRLLLEKK